MTLMLILLDFIVYRLWKSNDNNNCTIRCHPEKDHFPFEYGSSQDFFLMSFQGLFPCDCHLWL
ncbi:hypothetical protein PGIGA_G00067380, partial [Pangasianodon gigas]|nr:hypothetical protein [Pangasianodon gigas]